MGIDLVRHLHLFNTEGVEFKKLVFDKALPDLPAITNINEINKGALHNALQWHWQFAQRAGTEFDIRIATGLLLDEWGIFWNIPRPVGMSDAGYSLYIIQRVIGVNLSYPTIKAALAPHAVMECYTIGPWFDVSFMDLGPQKFNPYGGVLVYKTNSLYIVFDSLAVYDPSVSRSSTFLKAAGIAVFAGIWDTNQIPQWLFSFDDILMSSDTDLMSG